MRHFFLILFLVFSTTNLLAQEESTRIYGQITDSRNGNPIPGVSVIHSPGIGTTTDLDGRYSLNVPCAYCPITFSYIGYDELVVTISAEGQSEMRVDHKMTFSAQILDQVVVSAGRFEQKVSEVTVSMEVLKPDLLKNKNVTTMDQALQETPGMVIVDNEPQIRGGSGFSFGAGSRVQILVDGIPQLSGDAGRPTWGNLPLETVEQVEVIKGASSVLYGSSALSGVVNIRTTFPKGDPLTKISYFIGGYAAPKDEEANYWGGGNQIVGQQIMHANRIGNVDIVAGLMLLSDDGHLGSIIDSTGTLRQASFFAPSHYGADRRVRGNVNMLVKNRKVRGLQYGLNLNGLDGNNVNTLVWGNSEQGLFGAFDGSATTTYQRVANVNPHINYFLPNGDKALVRGNFQRLENDNDNGQGNFSSTWFGEAQYQARIDTLNLTLTAGSVINRIDGEAQLFSNGGLEPNHDASNLAFYLQGDKRLGERLNVSAGVRYEQFKIDGETDEKPIFRAGVNYHVGQATYIRASYGQGFRFPSIGEKFITTSVGLINIFPNPDLNAETSENIEFGLKQGFALGDFMGYADLALFQQNYTDFVEFTFGSWGAGSTIDDLGFASLNTGKARVSGAELSVAARGDITKDKKLSILAGYTYTLPEALEPDKSYGLSNGSDSQSYNSSSSDPTDNILKYRMQHMARFNIDYQAEVFHLGFGLRYNSFMRNIDGVFEDLDAVGILPSGVIRWREDNNNGALIMDARSSFQLGEIYRIGLVINNVFNREYTIRPVHLESNRLIQVKLDIRLQ